MALTVNTNIINDTDGYLLDAKNIKGTYIVVDTIDIRNSLPTSTTIVGTLCYVVSEEKTYRKTSDDWIEIISNNYDKNIVYEEGSINYEVQQIKNQLEEDEATIDEIKSFLEMEE